MAKTSISSSSSKKLSFYPYFVNHQHGSRYYKKRVARGGSYNSVCLGQVRVSNQYFYIACRWIFAYGVYKHTEFYPLTKSRIFAKTPGEKSSKSAGPIFSTSKTKIRYGVKVTYSCRPDPMADESWEDRFPDPKSGITVPKDYYDSKKYSNINYVIKLAKKRLERDVNNYLELMGKQLASKYRSIHRKKASFVIKKSGAKRGAVK